MKVGDTVPWWGKDWIEVNGLRISPEDVGTIVDIQPDRPRTGLLLYHDRDGEPVYDQGLEGWAVVQFPSGAKRALPLKETIVG
jgi:hypothetical protein